MHKIIIWTISALLTLSHSTAFAEESTSTDIYSDTQQSVYQIRVANKQTGNKSSIGSGFIVIQGDILATNYHVVSSYVNDPEMYSLDYLGKDGNEGSLKILDLDITHDLAVLQADKKLGPPLNIAGLPEKGAKLFSLGNPMDLGFSIVESVNNGIMENSEEKNILVSGSLNPGMSGGPTLNQDGEVVGINVATSGNEISFLVSAEYLVKILERLQARNFTPVEDIFQTMSAQLTENAQMQIDRLLNQRWKTTQTGKFEVPSQLYKTYRCWDASPSFRKEILYKLTSTSCSNQYNIYLDNNLEVGGIAYEYHWIDTEKLIPQRFYYSAYEVLNDSVPPGNAGKEDVTNFACHTKFIKISDNEFKATICRRDYLAYAGLSDVLSTIAMVGHPKEGFIFNMDFVGTDFNSAMDLLQKMLEKITWTE
ncbi:MAG: HtrA protease/chaperone protein [uncultured Thiotrichaceae bacterium]|uniref:HtrA protease/chaperone protein n=1 Tax=uncultured Thiotrichaceae bacterium TaxID=298394 RepID=A0A6S6TBD5_9GAMM|nr:MAG: HtrA protease/chaperone protein [uncultured Thiotrichaceae bacterium]